MKAQTFDRYAQRIDASITLLARTLAETGQLPKLDDLAAAAHFSPFHFHRVYRALTGETVMQTANRLRSAKAVLALAQNRSITVLAMEQGFATPQAFARCFRQATGVSPTQARSEEARLELLAGLLRGPASARLEIHLASTDPFEVVTQRHVGDHSGLNQTFTELFNWAAGSELLDRLTGLFGIAWDDPRDTPAQTTRFDAALGFAGPVVPPPEHSMLTLPGHCLRARHIGAYHGLYERLDALYLFELPVRGLEPRDAPVYFEYLDDPEEVAEDILRSDICIPVRSIES